MTAETPLVSCLCLTYARPEVLREAIWCFLQQDWPNKELVIINDHPEPIYLDRFYPGVHLYNIPDRFPNMGAKRNFSAHASRGEYLLCWDDDDLVLPWRISESMRHLLAAPDKWAFKPWTIWRSLWNRDYAVTGNGYHAQIAMRRSAFDQVGGYTEMNCGQDLDFESRIPPDKWIRYHAPVHELYYVYRWANGVTHISGYGVDTPGQPTSWERVAEVSRNQRGGGVITPGFDRDYWRDLAESAIANPALPHEETRMLAERLKPYRALGPDPI